MHLCERKKGTPNLTSQSFCNWVNDTFLPNSTLPSGAPRKISVEVDGHERADVIDAREEFPKTMTSLGFLHESNAANDETANHLPPVPVSPDKSLGFMTSVFNANEDEPTMWKDDTMQIIKLKGRGERSVKAQRRGKLEYLLVKREVDKPTEDFYRLEK